MNRQVVQKAILLFLLAAAPACSGTGYKAVSVDQAQSMIKRDSGIVLLDVRTEEEWNSETGHLANALLMPVQELEQRVAELAPYKGKTIIAYCRSGRRSERAAAFLSNEGFTAVTMEGGILQWNEKSLPVVKEGRR